MGLYVFNWPISVLGDWKDISRAHVIIIIKSELSIFPIVVIFFRDCVPGMFVTSYSVTYCIYVPGKTGICFHYHFAVYDECKYSDTFWLADRTRLFVQCTISLSSLCKLIWWHWIYKMPVRYFVECVSKIKHILSVIHYTICGAACFQFTHFSCDDWRNIYTLSYYHHQIGSMNYYPLLVCDLNRTPNCYGKTWRFLCPFFRNLHLRENLARDCFTSTVSTVTKSGCAKYLYPSTLLWQINCCNL